MNQQETKIDKEKVKQTKERFRKNLIKDLFGNLNGSKAESNGSKGEIMEQSLSCSQRIKDSMNNGNSVISLSASQSMQGSKDKKKKNKQNMNTSILQFQNQKRRCTFYEKYEDTGQHLGDGTESYVKKFKNKQNNKFYAVKIMRTDSYDEVMIQMKRMYLIQKSLKHEYICQTYELYLDEENSTIFQTLEFLEGYQSLEEVRKKFSENKIPQKYVKQIIYSLTQAIHFMHEHGICHRDLKPDNILIKPQENDYSNIKLIDFGTARQFVRRDPDKKYNTIMIKLFTSTGTMQYKAPELFMTNFYTESVDMWSVGIIIFQLLTGQFPFESSFKLELIELIGSCEIKEQMQKFKKIFNGKENLYNRNIISRLLKIENKTEKRMTAKDFLKDLWFQEIQDDLEKSQNIKDDNNLAKKLDFNTQMVKSNCIDGKLGISQSIKKPVKNNQIQQDQLTLFKQQIGQKDIEETKQKTQNIDQKLKLNLLNNKNNVFESKEERLKKLQEKKQKKLQEQEETLKQNDIHQQHNAQNNNFNQLQFQIPVTTIQDIPTKQKQTFQLKPLVLPSRIKQIQQSEEKEQQQSSQSQNTSQSSSNKSTPKGSKEVSPNKQIQGQKQNQQKRMSGSLPSYVRKSIKKKSDLFSKIEMETSQNFNPNKEFNYDEEDDDILEDNMMSRTDGLPKRKSFKVEDIEFVIPKDIKTAENNNNNQNLMSSFPALADSKISQNNNSSKYTNPILSDKNIPLENSKNSQALRINDIQHQIIEEDDQDKEQSPQNNLKNKNNKRTSLDMNISGNSMNQTGHKIGFLVGNSQQSIFSFNSSAGSHPMLKNSNNSGNSYNNIGNSSQSRSSSDKLNKINQNQQDQIQEEETSEKNSPDNNEKNQNFKNIKKINKSKKQQKQQTSQQQQQNLNQSKFSKNQYETCYTEIENSPNSIQNQKGLNNEMYSSNSDSIPLGMNNDMYSSNSQSVNPVQGLNDEMYNSQNSISDQNQQKLQQQQSISENNSSENKKDFQSQYISKNQKNYKNNIFNSQSQIVGENNQQQYLNNLKQNQYNSEDYEEDEEDYELDDKDSKNQQRNKNVQLYPQFTSKKEFGSQQLSQYSYNNSLQNSSSGISDNKKSPYKKIKKNKKTPKIIKNKQNSAKTFNQIDDQDLNSENSENEKKQNSKSQNYQSQECKKTALNDNQTDEKNIEDSKSISNIIQTSINKNKSQNDLEAILDIQLKRSPQGNIFILIYLQRLNQSKNISQVSLKNSNFNSNFVNFQLPSSNQKKMSNIFDDDIFKDNENNQNNEIDDQDDQPILVNNQGLCNDFYE